MKEVKKMLKCGVLLPKLETKIQVLLQESIFITNMRNKGCYAGFQVIRSLLVK